MGGKAEKRMKRRFKAPPGSCCSLRRLKQLVLRGKKGKKVTIYFVYAPDHGSCCLHIIPLSESTILGVEHLCVTEVHPNGDSMLRASNDPYTFSLRNYNLKGHTTSRSHCFENYWMALAYKMIRNEATGS